MGRFPPFPTHTQISELEWSDWNGRVRTPKSSSITVMRALAVRVIINRNLYVSERYPLSPG